MLLDHLLIERLALDPNNARKHSRKNIEAIKGSLAKFGLQKPIVVSGDNVVLAGNGTMIAAKELGWEKIWAYKTPLKGAEAMAFALADNRTSDLSEFDDAILAATLSELHCLAFDLSEIGFSEKDLEKILKDDLPPEGADSKDFKSMFEIVVECSNEHEQEQVFTQLTGEGYKCRVLSM